MHKELWNKFESLDWSLALQRAKCTHLENTADCYVITFLNKPYVIDLKEKKIFSIQTDPERTEAGFLEQLCILAYLIHSKDIPLSNQLTKGESLPGGAFFFRGHHSLPTDKLERFFGHKPELLYQACRPLEAKRCDYGDSAIEFLILPRVPVTFVVWGADDEFGARASILFDSTASEQMPLDALHVAVTLAVKAITVAVEVR